MNLFYGRAGSWGLGPLVTHFFRFKFFILEIWPLLTLINKHSISGLFCQTPSSYLLQLQSYEYLCCLFSYSLFFTPYICLYLNFTFADFGLHGPYRNTYIITYQTVFSRLGYGN